MATALNDSATNAAAVITIDAVPHVAHILRQIAFSYDRTPTGGNLKIESPSGTTLFDMDVTSKGAGPFSLEINGAMGEALIITLADGGAGVTGKINAVKL